MFNAQGVYHFAPRQTAFRNDYCLTCEAPRYAVQIRTFDVLYLHWVPILPIGFWNHWFCMSCGNQTRTNKRTRYGFKIAGLILLTILSVFFWLLPIPQIPPGDPAFLWTLRIATPIGTVITAIHLAICRRDKTHSELFQSVQPAADIS